VFTWNVKQKPEKTTMTCGETNKKKKKKREPNKKGDGKQWGKKSDTVRRRKLES